MTSHPSHTVPDAAHGSRLDAFIARVEGCGVREAKRRIVGGTVLVNGRTRPPHFKLRSGNVITVIPETPPSSPDIFLTIPTVAGVCGNYTAFVKPAGLHTAHIAGTAAPSLEHILAEQWETHNQSKAPSLLSRLDAVTSGLVLAASGNEAAAAFRAMEAAGRVSKYYLAVINGDLEKPLAVTNALDTANRAQTRVLPEADPDPTRHTAVRPLGAAASFSIPGAAKGTTLAAVRIQRGARHQIRAHLASAGFPVCGDRIYGPEGEEAPFRLHHTRLEMPECSFFCLPSWLPIKNDQILPNFQ